MTDIARRNGLIGLLVIVGVVLVSCSQSGISPETRILPPVATEPNEPIQEPRPEPSFGESLGEDPDDSPLWEELDPIFGYGDFSDTPELLVDYVLVTSLQAKCIQDNGYPVDITEPGNGLDFGHVPPEAGNQAVAVAMACLAGLRIPGPVPLTEEQIRVFYDHYVDVRACLAELGYDGASPPAVDVFIDTFGTEGMWTPYAAIGAILPERFDEVSGLCPEFPPLDKLAATY